MQDNNVWPFIDNQDSGKEDPHALYLFFSLVLLRKDGTISVSVYTHKKKSITASPRTCALHFLSPLNSPFIIYDHYISGLVLVLLVLFFLMTYAVLLTQMNCTEKMKSVMILA